MRKLLLLGLAFIFLGTISLFAQTKRISGKITNSKDGAALAGVSIMVKGGRTGTVSGQDGTFSLDVPTSATDLVVSYMGFASKEMAIVTGDMAIALSDEETRNLDEVVVVGYGTNSKRNMTGNVATVKGAEVEHMPVADLNAAIQGRAAGVFVESQNGKVGDGIKVRVRGGSSLSGSNQPLYVIDGVPAIGGTLYGSSTADINFDDVESFEILKDASASAIYGSRAANGVVLITTKRGKTGKTKFTVSSQYGSNKPTNDDRGFLNAQEYVDYLYMAATNAGKYHYNRSNTGPTFATEAAAIASMITYVEGRFNRYSGGSDWRNNETNTDWEKLAFQDNAHTNQVEVSAQGGSGGTKFYISGFTNNQDGILIGNKFKRSGGRMNLDNEVNKWLKIGVNLAVTKIDRNRVPDDNAFSTPMQIVALAPITPVYQADGQLQTTPVTTYYNPLLDAEGAIWNLQSWRNQGKAFVDISLLKNLSFRSEFGIDVTNQIEDRYWGPRTEVGNVSATVKGVARQQTYRTARTITNNYLSYNTLLNDVHKMDATLGMSYEHQNDIYGYVEGQGFPDVSLKTLASAAEITDGDGTTTEDNLLSYFARYNYSFDKRILVSLSARIDGSSRFGSENRYGFFPGGSVGWIATESEFLRNSTWLSFLKPRISYGLTGSNAISNYQAARTYGASSYATVPGLTLNNPGNPQLKWETTRQLDAGIEFGFFNNRLTGEIDYYRKKTVDLLYNQPVTAISGSTTVTSNIGEMENKGLELVLNSVNIQTRDLTWSTSFNISRNRNKLLKLDGEQTIVRGDSRFSNALVVGKPHRKYKCVNYARVDPANGDPLFYLADGQGTSNQYGDAGIDFVIGDPNPDYFAGITNTVSYKGIELSFLFQGVFGNQVQDGAGGFMSAAGDWFDNQTRDQLNSWKQPGDITNVPEARLNRYGDFDSPLMSSRYVYDASYVRLKNLTLGYTLPKNLLRKLTIENARVYVSGVNLLTFTDYPGWDPEVNTDYRSGNVNQGSDFYAAPQIKSMIVGLSIGF